MATNRNPEERSAHSGDDNPQGVSPHPTGEESFEATAETAAAPAEAAAAAPEGFGEAEMERVQAGAAALLERLTQSANRVREEAEQMLQSSRSLAAEHPMPLIGAAFVAGVAIGVLLPSRS